MQFRGIERLWQKQHNCNIMPVCMLSLQITFSEPHKQLVELMFRNTQKFLSTRPLSFSQLKAGSFHSFTVIYPASVIFHVPFAKTTISLTPLEVRKKPPPSPSSPPPFPTPAGRQRRWPTKSFRPHSARSVLQDVPGLKIRRSRRGGAFPRR